MSHSPQKSESMFLQRVQSSRLIIECKLGLTSLHDFVVHQVFCTFVLSVKGSHDPKGCRFSCLEKKTFIYNPIFSSKEIMCVCCTKWRCRKSWICICQDNFSIFFSFICFQITFASTVWMHLANVSSESSKRQFNNRVKIGADKPTRLRSTSNFLYTCYKC